MADNIAITAGSGTTIATDQVGSDHYQKIKLVDATADSSTGVASGEGTKTNALRIAPATDITDGTYVGDIKFAESLPAGTNAIGKLAANSGVDIGDVDVTSLPSNTFVTEGGALGLGVLLQGDDGTDRHNVAVDTSGHLQVDVLSGGGGGTQYSEDAAHTTGDTGTLALIVRSDTAASLAGTDGDYTGLISGASGHLWVDLPTDNFAAEGSALGKGVLLQGDDGTDRTNVLVDTSGHLQVDVLSGGGGGTQYSEDTAHLTGDTGTLALVVRSDTAANTATTDGDYCSLISDSTGHLWVHEVNSATIAGAVSGSEMQVDIVADGAGLATAANQTTIIGHVDGVEALLTTIDSDTSSMNTDLGTLAGAVTGTEMQVDVVASLPAGTNAIGKLAANSGVDIGDVDVTSLLPGTGASNLGKAEDAAHTTGDVGVMSLTVRSNTAAATSGTDGDYQPLISDTNGRLHVIDANSSSIKTAVELIDDAAATISTTDVLRVAIFDDSDAQITSFGGGTQYTEDAAAAANPVGNANILVRDDTPGALVSTDGDNVAQRGTNYGAAFCQIVDSSGNFVDSFGGSGGTSAADDADFVAGTTLGTPAMGVYESTPSSVTDGDLGTIGITSTRSLKVDETNSAAILADTASMDTNLGTVAGAVSGTEMQVDVVASLPAGTNAIGKLAANSGVDIGDVDVTSLVPGSGATNLGKAEDAAHTTGDVGVMALSVRQNTAASTSGTDGDYQPLITDTNGRLHVIEPSASGMATDLGTLAGAVSGTEMQCDIVSALPAGTNAIGKLAANSGVDIGDVDVTSLPSDTFVVEGGALGKGVLLQGDDGTDRHNVLVDASGHLQVDVLSGGGGGTQYAEDTAHTTGDTGTLALVVRQDTAASLAGTDGDYTALITDANGRLHVIEPSASGMATDLGTLAGAVSGTEMQCDILSVSAPLNVTGGGTEASALRVTIANNSTGVVSVDDNGGSLTVDGTLTASNTSGDVAHDGSDSGNPVKIGGKAYNQDGTAPGTAVVEGDRANFVTDLYGRQYVNTAHPNLWKATENHSTAQTNNSLKAAPGAGLSLYLTDIVISNGATAGEIKLVEDTGGTPVDILETMYFSANGGAVIPLSTPLKLTANKDVGFTSTTVTTHSITLSGFIAP